MTLTSKKKYTGITTLALTVLFLFSAAAFATEKSLDDRVNEIAYLLMCPVCQGQSVAESNSNLANDMRQIIRKQLEEGKTNQEVIDYFVSSYGDSILASPPKKGINWLLWVMPGVAVVLGAVGIALFLHKSKRTEDEVEFIPTAPGEESENEYLKKVDEELKKYE